MHPLMISNQLYEDDARIGHQEFDLKLTSRVKMSMVDRYSLSLIEYHAHDVY